MLSHSLGYLSINAEQAIFHSYLPDGKGFGGGGVSSLPIES